MLQMSRKRAPGPYNYDDDEDYVPSKAVKYSEREDVLPLKVKKHTLDSDEEEEEEEVGPGQVGDKNYDILKEEDIDGKERLCGGLYNASESPYLLYIVLLFFM